MALNEIHDFQAIRLANSMKVRSESKSQNVQDIGIIVADQQSFLVHANYIMFNQWLVYVNERLFVQQIAHQSLKNGMPDPSGDKFIQHLLECGRVIRLGQYTVRMAIGTDSVDICISRKEHDRYMLCAIRGLE